MRPQYGFRSFPHGAFYKLYPPLFQFTWTLLITSLWWLKLKCGNDKMWKFPNIIMQQAQGVLYGALWVRFLFHIKFIEPNCQNMLTTTHPRQKQHIPLGTCYICLQLHRQCLLTNHNFNFKASLPKVLIIWSTPTSHQCYAKTPILSLHTEFLFSFNAVDRSDYCKKKKQNKTKFTIMNLWLLYSISMVEI